MANNNYKRVFFCRLDSHEHCEQAIEKLTGTVLPGKMDLLSPGVHLLYVCMSLLYVGCSEPLNIKFADGSTNKKKVQGSSSRYMCMYSLDLYLLTCMFGTVKSGTFCISDILVFRSLLK